MTLAAMILSSRNSLSVLTHLPASLTRMMTKEKHVHHHESRSDGLLVMASCGGGGEEYKSRGNKSCGVCRTGIFLERTRFDDVATLTSTLTTARSFT